MILRFFVPGIPAPGGSKRAFRNKKTGAMLITETCKRAKPWRDRVASVAQETMTGPPLDGPLWMSLTFFMRRPKGDYGTGRNAGKLKTSARPYPTTTPDRTKLLRAFEDALTGVLWRDDTQIIGGPVEKCYAEDGMVGAFCELSDAPIKGSP